ncbi:MAG: hypothetical protein FWH59_00010 [Lentimicrobiaceae bacterium]|nr:hypothetical protein [Lentimicrobiaceae bacterium]
MNKNSSPFPNATPEKVWATLQETARLQAENERMLKENAAAAEQRNKEAEQRNKEAEQRRKESDAKFEKYREEYERRMKNMENRVGAWSRNHGEFAEEYFFNSFEQNQRNFFGEKFDELEQNVKGIKKNFKDEYDIVLINGKSVGIIEVKYKAHENDIPKILKKSQTFRVNFQEYSNHQIYLGLATMAFYPELEQACIEQGIAVIKQVGDTVVINDTHLKVF